MTEDEIKHAILNVCKVAGWDSDFNVVGFHALCDKLKELGVQEERERLRKYAAMMIDSWTLSSDPAGLKRKDTP